MRLSTLGVPLVLVFRDDQRVLLLDVIELTLPEAVVWFVPREVCEVTLELWILEAPPVSRVTRALASR